VYNRIIDILSRQHIIFNFCHRRRKRIQASRKSDQSRFKNSVTTRRLDPVKPRQRLGLRQSPAAFPRAAISKSGGGPPQSKTSRNFAAALPKQAAVLLKMLQKAGTVGAHPQFRVQTAPFPPVQFPHKAKGRNEQPFTRV
jgi:hypothetical protein